MPRFAQLTDMEARFEQLDLVQLTDGTDGDYDSARLTAALETADATINGYVARRHGDTTLLEGNDLLTKIGCDLAFVDLWKSDPPEWVVKRSDAAMRMLRDIADGKIMLDQGVEVAPPRPRAVQFDGPARRFGSDAMRDNY